MSEIQDQLTQILPAILPPAPGRIKGTEIIEHMGPGYSPQSIRYALTQMSRDPSSCIAKVEKGQGYYYREHTPEGEELARLKDRLAAYKGVLDLIELEIATAKAIAREATNG